MKKSDSINELATALAKTQAEIKGAIKDSDNPFYKSRYADLSSVWDACRVPMTKNGLSVCQTFDVVEGGFTVLSTVLMHTSGQWIESTMPVNPVKNDPQGLGSAATYCRRYSLSAIVGVAPEDDDGNAASGKTEPKIDSYIAAKPSKPITIANITTPATTKMASKAQAGLVWARMKNELQLEDVHAKDLIFQVTGKEKSEDLTASDINLLMTNIDKQLNHAVK